MDKRTLKNVDFLFILFTFLLLVASLFILSTASINVDKASPLHYVKEQAYWIISGISIAAVVAVIDYQKWRRLRWWIYAINLVLLLAVILIGNAAKGATRWIQITSSVSIQPSEFAKIFIIITFADFLTNRKGKLNNYRDFVLPFLFVLLPMLFILKQPDLGTALVFAAIFIGMMFVAGANPWKFGGLLLGGVGIIGVALWLHYATNLPGWLHWAQGLPLPMQDYQLKRLVIFVNPAAESLETDGIFFNHFGLLGREGYGEKGTEWEHRVS